TNKEVLATSLKLAKRLGKVGVVVGNCFGFVANRMLAYYMREAYLLLEEGATVEQIDRVLTEFGLPVGPFGMQDIAGIEIIARIATALANEGARVLEEGYATRAGDIDIIYVYGFGFPRYRGGPMFYADTVGLPTILARVKEYRSRFGDYWEPAPLLERLV